MNLIEIKFLIVAQICMDLALAVMFVYMIMRFRYLSKNQSFYRAVELFGSVLSDADKISGEFKGQLEQKNQLIQTLNEQLDKKISSLNSLLKKADQLVAQADSGAPIGESSGKDQEMEILHLAQSGHDPGQIAHALSIPKEEVRLVLDLKKRINKIENREGKS